MVTRLSCFGQHVSACIQQVPPVLLMPFTVMKITAAVECYLRIVHCKALWPIVAHVSVLRRLTMPSALFSKLVFPFASVNFERIAMHHVLANDVPWHFLS